MRRIWKLISGEKIRIEYSQIISLFLPLCLSIFDTFIITLVRDMFKHIEENITVNRSASQWNFSNIWNVSEEMFYRNVL